MQRVVIANLGGKALHLDEDAYDFLESYLDDRAAALRSDSTATTTLADLERRIGDQCAAILNADKNVVALEDIERIVRADPAFETRADAAGSRSATPGTRGRARTLYQVSDGAIISGVCMGLAEYFNLNATAVRIAFLILGLISSGGIVIAYIAMMFLMPFDPSRPPRIETGVPSWMHNFVLKTKRAFSR